MIEPNNVVLTRMLDRLFASMVSGPSMNAKPHNSRQRIDLAQLTRLNDLAPALALTQVLGEPGKTAVAARVPIPSKMAAKRWGEKAGDEDEEEELTPEERAAHQAYREQQSLINKLRVIADDARTYEQDTGVHALNIGYPLLYLPPGSFGGRSGISTRTVLAPIAFIPAALLVKTGAKQTVEFGCRGEGVDRVIPNIALLAWLEQQSGKKLTDTFQDEAGENPWREIRELIEIVAECVEADVPAELKLDAPPEMLPLESVPKNDDEDRRKRIVPAAVIGLFPTSNQGLVRDMREMVGGGAPDGPIESFVRHGLGLEPKAVEVPTPDAPKEWVRRPFTDERLVTTADPCQTRAVRLAHPSRGLVIHGPPGTGKSQTIMNIIGDHLARGERVLFVCDKRTALDVVADRLNTLGLSDLCAVVHDPQRDQRELYRSIREQLDNLADTPLKPDSSLQLDRVDAELQTLHDELSDYHRKLMSGAGTGTSFHELVGKWLAETGTVGAEIDDQSLQNIHIGDFDKFFSRVKEVLGRGEAVAYATNPWRAAIGVDLQTFLSVPMDQFRKKLATAVAAAEEADRTITPYTVSFTKSEMLADVGRIAETASSAIRKLETLAPAAIKEFATASAERIAAARCELDGAASLIDLIRSTTLNAEMIERAGLMPSEQVKRDALTLRTYQSQFEQKHRRRQKAKAVAGSMPTARLHRLINMEERAALTLQKKLAAAKSLAASIEQQPLDPSLQSRNASQPIEGPALIEALASLYAYIDGSKRWTSIFQFSQKKAAEPVVKRFGLSLNPDAAAQVRNFLNGLQQRIDLRQTLEAALAEKFEVVPEDDELVEVFSSCSVVCNALLDGTQESESFELDSMTDEICAAVNSVVGDTSTAAEVLGRFGQPLSPLGAKRVIEFLDAYEVRFRLAQLLHAQKVLPGLDALPQDAELLRGFAAVGQYLGALKVCGPMPGMRNAFVHALLETASREAVCVGIAQAPLRAKAILEFQEASTGCGFLAETWIAEAISAARAGNAIAGRLYALRDRSDTVEGVLRIRDGRQRLPEAIARACNTLLQCSAPAADALSVIRRNVLAGEISRRLKENPNLQAVDGHRMEATFLRFRELSEKKKTLVLELIRNSWLERQKTRLLSSTGNRRNKLGADLTMRLKSRGEKAMRLRQVVLILPSDAGDHRRHR